MRFLKKIINKINKGTKLIPGVMVLTVLLLSIGYSAFSSNSRISGISGEVRIKKDIRITGVQTLIETSPLCTLKEDTDGNGAVSVGDLYNCNPGDGYKDFYVLEIENEISLIMSENIDDETFNEDAAADAALLEKTTGWTDSRIGSITLPTVEQIVGGDPYSIGFSPKASWLYGNYWTSTYDPIGGTRWRVEGEYIDFFELDGIRPVITVETLDANDGESIYQEYNVNNISAGIRLPSENSSVTFKVRVTNIEAQEMAIANITGLPDNLEYELLNYSFKDKICDASGECNLGISKDILIRVKYKDEGYNSNDTEYNILLNFEFKPIYKVTYTGIDRTVCTLKNDTDGNGVVSVGDLYSCNPGDGDREFYVLETGDNISLIMSENIDNELLTADSINDGAEVDEALLEKTAGWTDSRISSIALPTTEQLTGYDANEWGASELLYSWLEGDYYTSDNESLGGGRWRVEGTYLDYFSSAGIRPVITISQNNWTIDKMGVYQLEVMEGDPVVADFDDNAPERLRVKINGGEVEDYAYSNGIFTINNVTGNLEVMRRIPILKTLTDSKVLLNNIYDVIDIHAGDMLDYKIYGNSVVENETVNLFNADAAVNDGVINEWTDALSKNEDGSYTLEKLPQGYRFTQVVPMFIASGTTIAMSVDIIDDGTQYGGLKFMLLDSSGKEVLGDDLTNNGLITSVSADVYSIQFILSGNELVGNYITFKNLQIEIGNKITDYRPYDEEKYQDYVENGLSKEIQSVGDLVVDTNNSNYGKYEIPLTLRMKNLININDFYKGGGLEKADYVEGELLSNYTANYYSRYNQKFSLNNGVINILGKNDAATPGKGSTAVGFLYIGTTEKWEAGTTYYFSCNIDVISNYYNTDTSYFRVTIDGKTFSIKKNATTGRYEGQVTLGSSVSNITNRYVQFRVDGCELNISNMLLSKSPDTTYRAYEESIVHSIYLDEPLRCVGDTCDYIDFKKQQVIRNVGVNTNVNSTVINEKFYVLNTPLIEPISLPAVSLVKGVNEIIVDTMLSPSKVTVYYYD